MLKEQTGSVRFLQNAHVPPAVAMGEAERKTEINTKQHYVNNQSQQWQVSKLWDFPNLQASRVFEILQRALPLTQVCGCTTLWTAVITGTLRISVHSSLMHCQHLDTVSRSATMPHCSGGNPVLIDLVSCSMYSWSARGYWQHCVRNAWRTAFRFHAHC